MAVYNENTKSWSFVLPKGDTVILTLNDLIVSPKSRALNIPNEPTEEHLLNLNFIINEIYEPLCKHFNTKVFISSGYRSKELNDAIKGSSKTSDHMTGSALDLDIVSNERSGFSNKDVFQYILNNLKFNQLIWEKGTDFNPDWVHVSTLRQGNNKQEVLRLSNKQYTVLKQKDKVFVC